MSSAECFSINLDIFICLLVVTCILSGHSRITFVKLVRHNSGSNSKTQKLLAKLQKWRGRGPLRFRFCNWLGTRGIGGNTNSIHL